MFAIQTTTNFFEPFAPNQKKRVGLFKITAGIFIYVAFK